MYKEFEKRVLEGTELFYSKESIASIEKFVTEQHSFVKYMKHVKKRIEEEMEHRVKLLHITTVEPLMAVLSDTLIKKHIELFDAEFRVGFCKVFIKKNFFWKKFNFLFTKLVTGNVGEWEKRWHGFDVLIGRSSRACAQTAKWYPRGTRHQGRTEQIGKLCWRGRQGELKWFIQFDHILYIDSTLDIKNLYFLFK